MQLADRSPAPPVTGVHDGFRLLGWWCAGVVVAVLHNGLWATPNLEAMSQVARHLGSNPFSGPNAPDYVMTDVLVPVVSRIVGQSGAAAYARLHLVVLVVLWAVVAVVARSRFGYRSARNLVVLLAVSPLVTVSMQWLGQPDPLTATLGILMVLLRPRWAVLVVAVLAGLTHPEQAVFMAAVAAVVRAVLVDDVAVAVDAAAPASGSSLRTRWRPVGLDLAASVGGVLLGRLVTEVYFRVAGIELGRPRTAYLDFGIGRFVDHHLQQPLGLLWTLWGPLWLVVAGVICVRVLRRGVDPGSARRWAVLATAAVLALVPVLVTLDETRVYAVITAPLLVGVAVLLDRERPPLPDRLVAGFAVGLLGLSLVVPGGFATGVTSWRGQLDTPAMVEFLRDGTRPPGDLTLWLLSPFDFTIPAL